MSPQRITITDHIALNVIVNLSALSYVSLPKSDPFPFMIFNLEIKNNITHFVHNVVLFLSDNEVYATVRNCIFSVLLVESG